MGMTGEALAIASALIWAVMIILSAKVLKKTDPIRMNALLTLISSVLMGFAAFSTGELQNLHNLDLSGFLILISAGIINIGIGDACLYKSVTLVGVSRSYPIAFTFPLFTMIWAILFFGEPFLPKYLAGTIITIFSIVIISTSGDVVAKKNTKIRNYFRGLLFALFSVLLYSVGSNILAVGLRGMSVIAANAIRFPFVFLFLLSLTRFKQGNWGMNRRNLSLLFAAGCAMGLGSVTFTLSIKLIGVSRAVTLSSSSPVWAAILSSIFLKEKVTWRTILSSLLVVAGAYLLI